MPRALYLALALRIDFSNGIFVRRLSLYFAVRELGQAVGWSGNPKEPLSLMISFQLLAKSRDLWGKPLLLLHCGEWEGHVSETEAKLNMVTQEITWVRPFLLQTGKRDEGMKSGSRRCKVWHWGAEWIIQVLLLLPRRWQQQPGTPKLWHRFCLRAGATAPADTAACSQQL